ncbi:unnamed protein product [Somion occarium]|uniref:Uncharacterized protein n=1 Tax=Somion occarium TaxID=3059160 RepID=A0ABP1CKF0_9APHY
MIHPTQTTHTQVPPQKSTAVLRGSLPFNATKRIGIRTFTPAAERLTRRSPAVVHQERFTFCEDDLVDVDPTDFSDASAWELQLASRLPVSPPSPGFRSLLSRSRSSLTGLKSSRGQPGLDKTIRNKFKSRPTRRQADDYNRDKSGALVLSLPNVQEVSSDEEASVHAVTDDSSSHYFEPTGLSLVPYYTNPKLAPTPPVTVAQEAALDPNSIPPSPPHSSVPTPTTVSSSASLSSKKLGTVRKSVKRFASLTKGNFFASSNPAPEVYQIIRTPSTNNEAHDFSSPDSKESPHILPELSFDTTPLSVLIHEDQDIKESPIEDGDPVQSLEQPVPEPSTRLPLIKYDLVDPKELTASPAVSFATGFTPAATPLLVPSPSFLSRNVGDFQLPVKQERPLLRIHPPSPAPLPILPRGLLGAPCLFGPDSSEFNSDRLSSFGTSHSTGSSVTLYSSSKPVSYVSEGSARSRPQSVNRASIIGFRQSFVDNRRSVQSFITCASLVFQEDHDSAISLVADEENSAKPRFFLLLHPPSPEGVPSLEVPQNSVRQSLSPLDIFDTNNLFTHTPDSSSRSSLHEAHEVTTTNKTYERFIPSNRSLYDNDRFPLPNYLLALARSIISSDWKEIRNMAANPQGKPADTVDWGDEVDYSGFEWFKDPPQRPERGAPEEPFVPDPDVIEKNDMFDTALKAAPSVLYGRYKQYGQLGVLAWCSEFGEMIEDLKGLGFKGSMFVSTRKQALDTCEKILQLDMNIEMQIIVMYLSSQVARLRRFLDGEKEWNDYPKPSFPLNPYDGES